MKFVVKDTVRFVGNESVAHKLQLSHLYPELNGKGVIRSIVAPSSVHVIVQYPSKRCALIPVSALVRE